jgi:serine/threonine protein kinase
MVGDLRLGEVIGGYELETPLGEGAMGVVFRARRLEDGTKVALKILRRELSSDAVYRRRFAHEVKAAGAVSHRNLIGILDAGESDGLHYIAMTYVPCRTLRDQINADGPLSVRQTAGVAAALGGALDAIHRSGLVHRDVKPSNVLVTDDGQILLTDFGIAKGRAYTVLTRTGQVVGTLDYMAPELIRGQSAIPQSDIYAMACVLFECVAGAPPFADKAGFRIGFAHLDEAPPDPCAERPELPPELARAVLLGLAKDPAQRPATAKAFANVIRMVSAGPARP